MEKKILILTERGDWIEQFQMEIPKDALDLLVFPDEGQDWSRMVREKEVAWMLLVAMPHHQVLSVLQQLREESGIGVTILYRRYEELEELACLEAGATDYIPFDKKPRILWRKLQNGILFQNQVRQFSSWGALTECYGRNSILLHDREIKLTRKEFLVLHELLLEPGRICSKEELLERVWTKQYQGDRRTLDTIVKQLRKKISGSEYEIRTHYRIGYSIELTDRSCQPSEGMEGHRGC